MEEKEIKRLLKLAVKKELSIQDVTDAILALHKKEVAKFRQSDVSSQVCYQTLKIHSGTGRYDATGREIR